jgi:formate dehydrogenase subunit gamma
MKSSSLSEGRAPARIVRFDHVQRAAHWANALLFGILMLTALPLYFGSLAGFVVQRHLAAQIHLWAGIALPAPVIVSLVGPWGRQMRQDVRRINVWTRDEIRWLKTLGRTHLVADKFNPGQKLNAIFVGGVIVVMLATGSMLKWFSSFPVSWRTGATFVHDVGAFAVFAVVFGHIALAITHRDAMRSMIKGWVTEKWAAQHALGWLKEEQESGTTAAHLLVDERRLAKDA